MTNITLKKLTAHPYCQAHVIVTDDSITLISYVTRVITIRFDGVRHVECTGTYSRTTARQIAWFLREYAPDLVYNDMKTIVGKGYVKM